MKNVEINISGYETFFTQEAYKVLRTNLQFCGQGIKTILITSCKENEGKTTITLHVAKSFAELGKHVLILDADLRKSVMVSKSKTPQNISGLSEILSGLAHRQDCIFKTQYPGLDIIFSGKYPPNPVELLNSRFFSDFLEQEKKEYDYIFIDTPPLGAVIDAAVIASQIDGALLVIGDKKIHVRQAQEVLEQLKKSQCNVLGVVRNQSHVHRQYYYKKRYYHN